MTAQIRQNRKTLAGSSAALPFMVVYGPTQNVDNSTGYQITWNSIDGASDTSVFTLDAPGAADFITINEDGLYLISAAIRCTAASDGGRLFVWLEVGGSVIAGADSQLLTSDTSIPSPCSVPWPIPAAETVRVMASQDHDLTLSIEPLQWSIVQLVKL